MRRCIHKINKCEFWGGQWRLIVDFNNGKVPRALESEPPESECRVSNMEDLCSEVRKILERMGRFFIRRMRIGFLHVPVKIFVRKMVEFETEVEKLNRAVVAVQKMMNKLNGVTSCALFE